MRNWIYRFLIGSALLTAGACIEPFESPIIGEDHSFLVVEGFLSNGEQSSQIKLSRTYRLADSAQVKPETQAKVWLEGDGENDQSLTHIGEGRYHIDHLKLQEGLNYRLNIRMADGAEYRSEDLMVKQTPPIDSLAWTENEEGVEVYVNTHDPANASTYYLWDYEEVWAFNSKYFTFYDYVNGKVVQMDEAENYTCWQSNRSKEILLGSSAKLSEDVIQMFPLAFVPRPSWKISQRYSILVRQYAISREAFEYFQQMKNNSELGSSIFAPQPVEVRGNIYSLDNPDELVLGFVGAFSAQEKLIFIENRQLTHWNAPDAECETISYSLDSASYYGDLGYVPLELNIYPDRDPPMDSVYEAAPRICADCRERGNPQPPVFWE